MRVGIILQKLITSDKGGGKCVCPRLSVCLLARLLKNAYMDLDEMLRVDRCRDLNAVADPGGQGAMAPKLMRNCFPQLYCVICASRDFYQVTDAWLLAP